MADVAEFVGQTLPRVIEGEKPRKEAPESGFLNFAFDRGSDALFHHDIVPQNVLVAPPLSLLDRSFDVDLAPSHSIYYELGQHQAESHGKWPRRQTTRLDSVATQETHALLSKLLERLDADEIRELRWAFEETLLQVSDSSVEEVPHPALEGLDDQPLSDVERLEATLGGLFWRFNLRHEQAEQSISLDAAADLLGVSREEIDPRRERGDLVAVKGDDGIWVFPAWQFDAARQDGMLTGLQVIMPLLTDLAALQKVAWLTQPKPALDGSSPIEVLREGQVDRVEFLARRVAGRHG